MAAEIELKNIDTIDPDIKALTETGIVMHQRLAEELAEKGFPVYENAAQRQAWATSNTAIRVASLSKALLMYRASKAKTAVQEQPKQRQQPLPVQPRQAIPVPAGPAAAPDAQLARIEELQRLLQAELSECKQTAALNLRLQRTLLGLLSVFGQNILTGLGPFDIMKVGEQEGESALKCLQAVWELPPEAQ